MKKTILVLTALVLSFTVVACSSEPKENLLDGEYVGTTSGFYDHEVKAVVVISNSEIAAIEIDTSNESDKVGEPVGELIAQEILRQGGTDGVEAIATATVSSEAAIEAANKAITQSKTIG